MIAVTIHSEAESEAQIEQAERLARDAGFPHTSLKYSALQNINFRTNPVDRCYHCKLSILGMLRKYAREYGFEHVVEGQNTDDAGDYRPGRKAVSETETLSPLAECGFSKKDIRQAAKVFGLPVWNLPSSPCLASRFPYGTSITVKGLDQVAKGEEFLHSKGFQEVRVRYHNELARLEVAPEKIQSLLELRDEVNQYFKSIGFLYVTVDLQGYRQGSLNEGLGL
jgi:uncharacterized protein